MEEHIIATIECEGYTHRINDENVQILQERWERLPHWTYRDLERIAHQLPGIESCHMYPSTYAPKDRNWLAKAVFTVPRSPQIALFFSSHGELPGNVEVRAYAQSAEGYFGVPTIARNFACQLPM